MNASAQFEGSEDSVFDVWADFIKSCVFDWTKKSSRLMSQSYHSCGMLHKRVGKLEVTLISWWSFLWSSW